MIFFEKIDNKFLGKYRYRARMTTMMPSIDATLNICKVKANVPLYEALMENISHLSEDNPNKVNEYKKTAELVAKQPFSVFNLPEHMHNHLGPNQEMCNFVHNWILANEDANTRNCVKELNFMMTNVLPLASATSISFLALGSLKHHVSDEKNVHDLLDEAVHELSELKTKEDDLKMKEYEPLSMSAYHRFLENDKDAYKLTELVLTNLLIHAQYYLTSLELELVDSSEYAIDVVNKTRIILTNCRKRLRNF
jgi:hypothetical protein